MSTSMSHAPRFLTLALAALVVGGCFKLARTTPPVERFVLGSGAMASPAPAAPDTAGFAIGIRRLDLAPYLATLDIVVRRGEHEIVTTGFQRWAENPTVGFNRAVAAYLAVAPGIQSVDVVPWPIRSQHDFLVQFHVSRLEGVTPGNGARSGEAQLFAQWEVIHPGDGALLARGVTEHRAADWTVSDYRGLVKRLDDGVMAVAKDVASCLARLAPVVRADSLTSKPATMECGSR